MEDPSDLARLDKQLKYFQSALQYLDASGNLKLIRNICDKYKTKLKCLVYTFKLLVDPLELLEMDDELGNLLLTDQLEVTKLFQEVVYKCVCELQLLPDSTVISQVAVVLRLSTIPAIPNVNIIDSVRCLTTVLRHGGFCLLRGIVTGMTAVSKYTQSARFFCGNEDCEGNTGNHFIRVHTPGASEAQTIRKDFRCTFCYAILTEEKSSRILSDRLVAEVIPIYSPSKTFAKYGQVVPVFIRDDLTKKIALGQSYDIIGLIRKDIQEDRITLAVEANNVQKIVNRPPSKAIMRNIPNSVRELNKDRKSSPWSFVLTLAYFFGGEVCPHGSYMNLKLAVLLSLMSHNEDQCRPVHLLALGRDTGIVGRLLQYATMFSPRAFLFTSGNSLTGRVMVDHYKTAAYFMEGGLLHLSQSGVCYMGDIKRLKKADTEKIQSVLGDGKVVVDIESKFTGGLPQQREQALGCCVWAYTDPASQKKPPAGEEVLFACQAGDLPKPLLDSFSLLCFTDCGEKTTEEEICDMITQQTLASAMTDPEDDVERNHPLSFDDFQTFLATADKLRPTLLKDSETLIHSYYLACRKSRSSGMSSSCVPVTAYQSMLSLAFSHAKLALRSEVTVWDSLMAIKLYEESLTARFGLSLLSLQPVPHVTPHILNESLGPKHDWYMEQFHTNLLKFCAMASGMEE